MLSKAVMHKINKLAKAIQPACGDYHEVWVPKSILMNN